ncbi:hypothetical protein CEXT_86071 [Caerostris extrusa]|uniref:Uncharacterized protein n=1 Tax=Caerostris extrusa TaxID=172846 RepID=A0AAV4SER5_CAEEX|nr:hypothetical protein CEXT_86071 [Caerostris extrusa]
MHRIPNLFYSERKLLPDVRLKKKETNSPSLGFHRLRGWPKRYCASEISSFRCRALYSRQQWPFQSPPDRANPQQFPCECFPGDITQSPEASADNVTPRNSFKRYFSSLGLYGAAESHKLALGSIRVLRPLLDILEFGWALRGIRFHFLKLF